MKKLSKIKNIVFAISLLIVPSSTLILAMEASSSISDDSDEDGKNEVPVASLSQLVNALDLAVYDDHDNVEEDDDVDEDLIPTYIHDPAPHVTLNSLLTSEANNPQECIALLTLLVRTALNTIAYDAWTNPRRDNFWAVLSYRHIKIVILKRLLMYGFTLPDFTVTLEVAIKKIEDNVANLGACNWIGITVAGDDEALAYQHNSIEAEKYWIPSSIPGITCANPKALQHQKDCNMLVKDQLFATFRKRFTNWGTLFSALEFDELLPALAVAHEQPRGIEDPSIEAITGWDHTREDVGI